MHEGPQGRSPIINWIGHQRQHPEVQRETFGSKLEEKYLVKKQWKERTET